MGWMVKDGEQELLYVLFHELYIFVICFAVETFPPPHRARDGTQGLGACEANALPLSYIPSQNILETFLVSDALP